MPEPKAQYPVGSTFEIRIHGPEGPEKGAVADYVVRKFLGKGQSAFVSDGSSTFFVGLSLFEIQREDFVLYTNSLPIAHEFPLWRTATWPGKFSLSLVGGHVDADLMMTSGRATFKEIVSEMAREAQWTILSVRAIYGNHGPAGREPDSLRVKDFALTSARRVILLADHAKLSEGYETVVPLLYAVEAEWKALLQRDTTHVITTLPPGKTTSDMRELFQHSKGIRRPQTPVEWYAFNTWPIRSALGDRFVEIPCP